MDEVNLHSDDKPQIVFGIKLGKNLSIFLVCLFLTTIFWLLNAFTKDYSTEIYFPLRYENLPAEEVVVNELPRFLAVEVNGFGFKLLSFYLFGSLDSLSVDYADGIKKYRLNGSSVVIPKSSLKSLASLEIPSDIKIEGLNIDSLRIHTDPITDKILAIKPVVNYSLQPQYYLKDSISVSPKKVLISGPKSIIEKMDFISTKTIELGAMDKSVAMDVSLDFPKNFSSLTKKVRVALKIDRATEKELTVPINIVGDSTAKFIKIFPEQIQLKVKVGLSDFEKIKKEQFKFEVVFDQASKNKKLLNIRLISKPNQVEIISFTPRKVEFITLK